MSFLSPLAFLFALSLPVVVVFYLLLSIAVPEQCDSQFEANLLVSTVIFSSFNVGLLLAAAVQLRNPQNW